MTIALAVGKSIHCSKISQASCISGINSIIAIVFNRYYSLL
jgi:hypothetical protein